MTLTPAQLMERLEEIERDLARREPELEDAARDWFVAKREKEKMRAESFMESQGTVAERNAQAELDTATIGMNDEAHYEALRAVVRVMETRAQIGMSLLKAHGRAGA